MTILFALIILTYSSISFGEDISITYIKEPTLTVTSNGTNGNLDDSAGMNIVFDIVSDTSFDNRNITVAYNKFSLEENNEKFHIHATVSAKYNNGDSIDISDLSHSFISESFNVAGKQDTRDNDANDYYYRDINKISILVKDLDNKKTSQISGNYSFQAIYNIKLSISNPDSGVANIDNSLPEGIYSGILQITVTEAGAS